MNYGQAVGGDEAIASYNKGIEILERDLTSLEVQQHFLSFFLLQIISFHSYNYFI